MRRLFANLLLAGVAVAAISFFVAPGVAFFAIRSAAEAGDVQGLTRLIDFSAVRQSLRPQLIGRPEAMAPAPSFLEDPIGAFRHQLQQNPILRAQDVDAYLTPAALSALTRGEGRYAGQWTTTAATDDRVDKPWPRLVFWGVSRARFAVQDQGGSRTIFTFERRGPFTWTLVQIGLPDGDGAPSAATLPASTPRPAPRKDTP